MCHDLLTAEPDQPHNMFITFKEWSEKQQKLSYPSDSLVTYVCAAVTSLENFLPAFGGKTGVTKDAIQQMIQTIPSAWLTCDQHKDFILRAIATGVCLIGIPWYCKRQKAESIQAKKAKKSKSTMSKKMKKLQHI